MITRSYVTLYTPKTPQTSTAEEKSFSMHHAFFGSTVNTTLETQSLLEYYRRVAPLKSALDMLSRSVSSLPIQLVDTTTDTPVTKHPLLDLLKKPNTSYQKTRTQFFLSLAFWKVLSGDVYIILTGKNAPLEAYVLRSTDIRVQMDTSGFIDYYEYQQNNTGFSERYSRNANGQYFSPDGQRELLHLSSLIIDPDTTDQGAISDLAALRNEFELYISVTTHNISLLNNGGRPSGALKVPADAGNLDPKARAELQQQIASTFAGAQNAGRPMLLEGGLDWINFATSPKDGDFNTTKSDAEAQIFKAVGVPLDLAGNSKAVSANNMVNIRREFYKSRVVPLMVEMLEFLNNFLLPRYKSPNLELRVDYTKIDVFLEERMDMMKLIETSTSRTPNEKRKAQGLPADLEGGDNLYDPNGRFIAGPDAAKFMNSTRMINTPTVATS